MSDVTTPVELTEAEREAISDVLDNGGGPFMMEMIFETIIASRLRDLGQRPPLTRGERGALRPVLRGMLRGPHD